MKRHIMTILLAAAMVTFIGMAASIDTVSADNATCEATPGCTLTAGHEGDCVVNDENTEDPNSDPEPASDQEVACTKTTGCSLSSGHEGDCVPYVATVDGTSYTDLSEAVDKASDGSTVTMTSDVTLNSTLNINKNLTLDMNGKKITHSGSTNPAIQCSTANTTVTIKGGTISTSSTVVLNAIGETVTVNLVDCKIHSDGAHTIQVASGATLNMTGCNVDSDSGYVIFVANGNVNLDSTSVSTPGSLGIYSKKGNVTLTNKSSVKSEGNFGIYVLDGNVSLNNSSAYAKEQAAIYSGSGNITLTNNSSATAGDYAIYAASGNVSLTDSTVSTGKTDSTTATGTYGVYSVSGDVTLNNSTIDVTGQAGIQAFKGNVTLTNNSSVTAGSSFAIYATDGNVSLTDSSATSGANFGIINLKGDVSLVNSSASAKNFHAIKTSSGNISLDNSTADATTSTLYQENGSISVTNGSKVTGKYYVVNSISGDVTITNSSASADADTVYVHDGTVKLGNADITATGSYALTILNGEVSIESSNIKADNSPIYIGTETDNTVTLTLDKGSSVTGTSNGISAHGSNITLNIYGKVNVDSNAAVITNGSPQYSNNTTNVYDGAEITCTDGWGIYAPTVQSTTNIYGGTITGGKTAIEIRGGTLNVEGGTLTSTATEFEANPNNNGATTIGAAIAVSQHTTNDNIVVNIKGGTLNGIYALYEDSLQEGNTKTITINVENGDFNVDVATADCEEFISGGTFAYTIPAEYCASTYAPIQNLDGTYTVCNHSNVSHVPAKAATATADGNIEYWYCYDCDKYFADDALDTEVSQDDIVLKATGSLNGAADKTNATSKTDKSNAKESSSKDVSANTADTRDMLPWIALLLASLLGMSTVFERRRYN